MSDLPWLAGESDGIGKQSYIIERPGQGRQVRFPPCLPSPAAGSSFIIGLLRNSCWTDVYIIYMKS